MIRYSLKGICPTLLNSSMRFMRTRFGFGWNGGVLNLKVDSSVSKINFSSKLNGSMLQRNYSQQREHSWIVSSAIKNSPRLGNLSPRTGYNLCFSTTSVTMDRLKAEEVRRRVEDLTERFAEARELLGDARESLGSTYFSEDMMDAQEAVTTTMTMYKALLADLDDDQRNDVIRSIGLRMEELKAQEQAIKDILED